jgi:hypothetical protein
VEARAHTHPGCARREGEDAARLRRGHLRARLNTDGLSAYKNLPSRGFNHDSQCRLEGQRSGARRAPCGASRRPARQAVAAGHAPRRNRRAARRGVSGRVHLPLHPAPVQRARPALLSAAPERRRRQETRTTTPSSGRGAAKPGSDAGHSRSRRRNARRRVAQRRRPRRLPRHTGARRSG